MELTELCQELNNWFVKSMAFGNFTISDGEISLSDFLQDGQYFRIVGSVFNDGVYQYPATNLTDETFDGAVWSMAVPPSVIDLLHDITNWQNKYNEAVLSPYASESFGGYSYTKASGFTSDGTGNGSGGYKTVFADKLNRWRKA